MKIEADAHYPEGSPELEVIGKRQTRAKYRHEGRGPAYIKVGSRVVYFGQDVLDWLEARRVTTNDAA